MRPSRTAPSKHIVALAIVIALGSAGCKLKLEATVTGPAPGATDKVRVRVASVGGAELSCSDRACEPTKVPAYGETHLVVQVPTGDTKTVVIRARKGVRWGSKTVDLAAGGEGSSLVVKNHAISCVPTGCRGAVAIAPSASLTFEAPAGTTIELGGEKLTVPASGSLTSPLKLALSPPLERQPLATICTGAMSSGKAPVLASTAVTVTLPGKSPLSAPASLDAKLAEAGLATALVAIKSGPVLFPWEKAGAPAKGKRAAAFVHVGSCYDAGTAGATVADIDVIALAEDETRESECVYHLTSGGVATGDITLNDKRATAYDRITGRQLGTKLFAAEKDCDKKITVEEGDTTVPSQSSSVDGDLIAKWALTFAR